MSILKKKNYHTGTFWRLKYANYKAMNLMKMRKLNGKLINKQV